MICLSNFGIALATLIVVLACCGICFLIAQKIHKANLRKLAEHQARTRAKGDTVDTTKPSERI